MRSSDLTDVASAELRARNDRAAILHRSWTKTMRAQVDHLDDAGSTAPANELELHVDEWSISMHGPAAMVPATRIGHRAKAQRLDAHARPKSRTVRDATLKTPHGLWAASRMIGASSKQRL